MADSVGNQVGTYGPMSALNAIGEAHQVGCGLVNEGLGGIAIGVVRRHRGIIETTGAVDATGR